MYKRAYTSVKNNCRTPMLSIFAIVESPAEIVGFKIRGETEVTFIDRC